MTDIEFINKLSDSRVDDITYQILHPQWKELSNEPQFKKWFYEAVADGVSNSDMYYLYCDSKIDRALGSRLSWFNHWDCFGKNETIDLFEDDEFPLYAHAFDYEDKKYWVLTLVGQGAYSWLMTDKMFQQEYIEKENNK